MEREGKDAVTASCASGPVCPLGVISMAAPWWLPAFPGSEKNHTQILAQNLFVALAPCVYVCECLMYYIENVT